MLCALLLNSVLAFGQSRPQWLGKTTTEFKESLFNKDYDFEGIVRLNNCSGSLVIFEGAPKSMKAIVMTNGHCIPGMVDAGEYTYNESSSRRFELFKTLKKSYRLKAEKLLYATMTGTDVAFYQVRKTYQEIEDQFQIRPLLLSARRPQEGIAIEVISGYWKRGYSCDLDSFIYKMLEADWTFTDSIKYTRTCDTIAGTSGSPIVETGKRLAIGINNTGNESGRLCTMNNPCEVDQAGEQTADRGASYGQQTYIVYSCLDKNFKIDLGLANCKLFH